jgi:hypothetical protein
VKALTETLASILRLTGAAAAPSPVGQTRSGDVLDGNRASS